MQNLIDQLQAIETLLEKAIDSDDWLKLLKSNWYNPDTTVMDALQGVREAIQISAALAAKNAETLPQQDIGVLSNDDET